MTILQYISATHFGGAERYFIRMAEHLQNCGHRLIIVAVKDTPLCAELQKRNFETHAWPRPSRHDFVHIWKLCRLIRREKVDVINTHLTRASLVGTLAGKLTDTPVAVRIAAAGDRFPQKAPHFIAVAQGVRNYLVGSGVEPEKVEVLYNGVDLEKYSNPTPSPVAKAQLGFPEDSFLIGVVANLRERKGHPYLFRAAAALLKNQPQTHILCVGSGDEAFQASLYETTKELGISSQVHFLGERSDIVQILAALDIFVLPSLKEGLSNAVMEAMVMGCPVIATDVGGQAEVVKNEQTGLLVPPADEDALRRALQRLIESPGLRQKLSLEGETFIRNSFDQKLCLERVEAHLVKLGTNAKNRRR